jgi:hypothetical protein
MANRFHTYFGQIVTPSELNEIFESLFSGIDQFVQDFGFSGVAVGAVATQHTPPNLTVDVSGPAVVYDQMANRMTFGSPVVVNCTLDENGSSTSVVGGSNQKWLSLFIEFTTTPSDPRTDELGATVYYRNVTGYRINVVQGAEAPIGTPTRPALRGDQILLADVLLGFSPASIVNADISTTRTQVIYDLTGSPNSIRARSLEDVLQSMLGTINSFSGTLDTEAFDRSTADTALGVLISTTAGSVRTDEAVRAEVNALLNFRVVDTGGGQVINAAAMDLGNIVAVGAVGTIMYSFDGGLTWSASTAANSPASGGSTYNGTFYDVLWVTTLAKFVAVGSLGEIQTSPDGVTWTHQVSGDATDLHAIAFNGTTLCTIGNLSGAGKSKVSTNGTAWSTTTQAFQFSPALAGGYSSGLFVAHEAVSANMKSSPDGVTWTTRTLDGAPVMTAGAGSIGWSYTQGFLVVGAVTTPRIMQQSPTGTVWTSLRTPASTGATNQVLVTDQAAYALTQRKTTAWVAVAGVSSGSRDFTSLGPSTSSTPSNGKPSLLRCSSRSQMAFLPTGTAGIVGLSQAWAA